MTEYKITWVIEISAESAEDAAKQALEIMRDHKSTATVFAVQDVKTKKAMLVDVPR